MDALIHLSMDVSMDISMAIPMDAHKGCLGLALTIIYLALPSWPHLT